MADFQFRFIALIVDVIDRRGPSNEMRHPDYLQFPSNWIHGGVTFSEITNWLAKHMIRYIE